MATAAAAAAPEVAAPIKSGGKKKLVLMIAVLAVLLVSGGGAAAFYLKQKAAAEQALLAEAEDEEAPTVQHEKLAKPDPKHPPTFLPLDPFVVNLADKDADRYAQIAVTLEVEDAKAGELIKLYMPAIRNGILMVMAHKNSQQLLERAGKDALAAEILREAVRPLGYDVALPAAAASGAATGHGEAPAKAKVKGKGHDDGDQAPVRRVHFSNFIIQ